MIDHFLDIEKKVIFGLVVVDSFLIHFDVIHKIDVWEKVAKGGVTAHRNTNRLSRDDFPNSVNLSFLS